MSGQQAFFTSDTALARRSADPDRFGQAGRTEAGQGVTAPLDLPRRTLAERLIEAWLAPWSHGFTPLW